MAQPSARHGFTLIELLIVVAIIGILASIAVVNLLAARTRANVARVEADLYALAQALETYYIDHESFPDSAVGPGSRGFALDPPQRGENPTYYPGHTVRSLLTPLTSPIPYISSVSLDDPFLSAQKQLSSDNEDFRYPNSYLYFGFGTGVGFWGTMIDKPGYLLCSVGPDGKQNYLEHMIFTANTGMNLGAPGEVRVYSPANGLTSPGDIYRAGGVKGFHTGGGH